MINHVQKIRSELFLGKSEVKLDKIIEFALDLGFIRKYDFLSQPLKPNPQPHMCKFLFFFFSFLGHLFLLSHFLVCESFDKYIF